MQTSSNTTFPQTRHRIFLKTLDKMSTTDPQLVRFIRVDMHLHTTTHENRFVLSVHYFDAVLKHVSVLVHSSAFLRVAFPHAVRTC